MSAAELVACRGVRGAVTVDGDGEAAVTAATTALLSRLLADNDCRLEDLAAAVFTVPDDLSGANPAAAARAAGWASVPLLMVREHPGDLEVHRCLRVLLLWNTTRAQADVRHAYLGGAAVLRPDLSAAREPRRLG